jgi:polyhydroxybutyrate depolymerase
MFTGLKRGFTGVVTPVVLIGLMVILLAGCKKAASSAITSLPATATTLPTTATSLPVKTTSLPAIESPTPARITPEGEALVPGDSKRSLIFDGLERTYILHIPTGYHASRPVPLVLVFHGIGLDGNEMIRISGFNAQSDLSGFIVVYPDGTGAKKSWNGGHCCGEAAVKKVDDVGFVQALIGELANLVPLDPKRIYASGFSNGAIMVYRLACALSGQIAAIAPVSATPVEQDLQTCQPGRPVPVMHFHGTADKLNPYPGGKTSAGTQFISVDDAIQFWVGHNGCPEQAQQTKSGTITHDRYAPCTQNASVELYSIAGGEHAWPGGESVSPQIGEPTKEISATSLMWEFFVSHALP